MRTVLVRVVVVAALAVAAIASGVAGSAQAGDNPRDVVRFATFNASLNRNTAGALRADLSTAGNPQASAVAEIIQRVRPDVLLINEFDFDPQALVLFQDNYLSISQSGAQPIMYPHRFIAPSNTGIASGFDLNNNGQVVTVPGAPGYADDALGFGAFPGQFGMAVYSMYEFEAGNIRTFQEFLWKDMPGALLPDDPATAAPADWYSPEELAIFRLSSKSHWDLPISIGNKTVHFLVSHPTPPVFDGPEDRNGRRNHDEIRFWADYISPNRSRYIYDDDGDFGGLPGGSLFVIAGDQNSDPFDGDSVPGSAQLLLEHPLINAGNAPTSPGAVEAAALQGGANATHRGNPAFDTADFADVPGPGNLRADYVLPRVNVQIKASAVFWPVSSDPLSRLTGTFPFPSSDHRLVWIDAALPGA
jgi:Endonuclease/Exonuclease/phosphatase family